MINDAIQAQIQKQVEFMKEQISKAKDSVELKKIEVDVIGKKGKITNMMKVMKDLTPEERPEFGKRINKLRNLAVELIEAQRTQLQKIEQEAKFAKEKIDVSLPGKREQIGSFHPITKGYYEIRDIFLGMGFA